MITLQSLYTHFISRISLPFTYLLIICAILFLILPILALHTLSQESISIWSQDVFTDALFLSLWTSTCALITIICSMTPLAWFLAHRPRTLIWQVLESICLLPLVLPPTVCGIALLWTWGSHYWGTWSLALSTPAVIMAQVFVSAPIFLKTMTEHFRHFPTSILEVAKTLGHDAKQILYQVYLPMSFPIVLQIALLTWLRAMGEFGATLLFAGHLPQQTQTLPLAIYTSLEDDLQISIAMTLWLLWIAILFSVMIHKYSTHK